MASSRRRGRGATGRAFLAWSAVIFASATLGKALVGDRGLLQVWKQRREAAGVEREIGMLRRENSRLQEEIRALRGDPRALEPIAREDLGYAKPGEIVILFPRSNPSRTAER
jgi:cell division protein FtsB